MCKWLICTGSNGVLSVGFMETLMADNGLASNQTVHDIFAASLTAQRVMIRRTHINTATPWGLVNGTLHPRKGIEGALQSSPMATPVRHHHR